MNTHTLPMPVVTDWPKEILRLDRRIAELEAALHAAETIMMIVEPRSDKAEYLATLKVIRAVLAASASSDATEDRKGEPT